MQAFMDFSIESIEESSSVSPRSLRQKFGDWKKSYEGREAVAYLYRRQRGLCPSCFAVISLNKDTHVHHCYPISAIEKEIKEKDNSNANKVTSLDNLVLLCKSCNLKQSSKVDERFR